MADELISAEDFEPLAPPEPAQAQQQQWVPLNEPVAAEDFEPMPQGGGALSVFGREVAQTPITMTGAAIKGTAMLPPNMGYGDMPMPPGTFPEAEEMVRQAAVEQQTRPITENPLYKAGEAVQEFGKRAVPISEAERAAHPIAAGIGSGVGAAGPLIVAGLIDPAAAIAGGAAIFGLSSAADTYDAAKAKGADEATAREAAGLSGAANAAIGVLPIGNVLKPFAKFMPEASGLAVRILAQAGQNGVTFGSIGEVQHFLGQEIAKLYDSQAGYDLPFTTKEATERLIGELGAGAVLGTGHGIVHEIGQAASKAKDTNPDAAAALGAHAANIDAILGGLPPAALDALPVEDRESILGGQRQVSERSSLQAAVDNGVPVQELVEHPMVQRALGQNRAAVPTGTPEEFADPEWRAARVYNFGGEQVQGWDNAVERLTNGALAFSTEGPVEDGRRAVIVLGPPASGKSAISEPLARAMRAAIVDPDEAKKVIPEYRDGLGTQAVHEESSLMAKSVLSGLLAQGKNVVLPRVGDKAGPTKGLMDVLHELGYTVDIAHVAATPEIAGQRNIRRFLKTGRLVDPDYITQVGDKPRQTAYALRGEANDFADANTSHPNRYEIIEGTGPLADVLRNGRYGGQAPNRGGQGSFGAPQGAGQGLLGRPSTTIPPHRVTAADGSAIDVAPVVVEASNLLTSQDQGYDTSLQPRQRDRAASQAQVRDIASNLDPERLGYSSEADRGAPIVGPDGMVESGNGRVLALRSVYQQGGARAAAYRAWLSQQGVDISAYRNPILVRQRTTPLQPDERRAFSVAANQAATLAFSAPERALSDARSIDDRMLGLLRNPDDLGAAANRDFVRRFVAQLPQGEQGTMADAKGHLSAEGLARVRNAILAKAYDDTGILARIAESTNDDVKSISNALTAVAPAWAKLRAEVAAGRVRPDMDATAALLEAVRRTADIRGRGDSLEFYLNQQDAFDRMPAPVEALMRIFYDPKGQRAAGAKRIADALKFYADEAGKVSADEGLGLGLVPVDPRDILRLAAERQWSDYGAGPEVSDRNGAGYGASGEEGSREARGLGTRPGGEEARARGPFGDQESAERAQRPTREEGRRQRIAELVHIIHDRGFVTGDFYVRTDREGVARWITRDEKGEIQSVPISVAEAADRIARLEFYDRGDRARPDVLDRASYDALRQRAEREASVPGFPNMRFEVEPRPNGAPWRVRAFDGDKQVGILSLKLETIPVEEGPRGNRPDAFVPAGFVEGVSVEPEYRRKGIGNALYRAAETAIGDELTPSRELLPDARAFWDAYRPGAKAGIDLKPLFDTEERAQRPDIEDLFAAEPVTLAGGKRGEQHTIPQTERISGAELARRRAAEPMRPRVAQQPMESGLFGDERLQDTLKFPTKAPTIPGEEAGHGTGSTSGTVHGTAPQVPGRQQPRRAPRNAVERPEQLSLFGGGTGEQLVPDANAPVQGKPGEAEGPAPATGPVVTKPPARGRGDRAARRNLPAPTRDGLRAAEQKIAERSRANYRITPEDHIGEGGPKQKVRANLEAIRVLKLIEDENRLATPGEKAILVKYSGWGAFAQDMFAHRNEAWKSERDALRAALTDEEYEAAKGSTLNAHFTSPEVVRGMWDALDHLGYRGGSAIEPAAGVGHFIGMTPDKVAPKTAWTAVELDSLSGRITKALYGGADVNVHGFEDLKRPSNYYDLAISNVPFGNYNISEKPYGSFPIHDFFFVKSLDKVRPGGVVAFITSRYTMDRMDPGTRRLLSNSADLVGAIRLPGGGKGAFASNAGTAVTTDVLFLRKKVPGEKPFPGANWEGLREVKTPEGPVNINEYFADRPNMMLGEMRLQGSMYRDNEPVLIGDVADLQQKIAEAAKQMPAGALLPRDTPPPAPISGDEIGAGVKDGAFFLKDGELYQRNQGQGIPHPLPPDQHDRVVRLMGMRDLYNGLLENQLRGTSAMENDILREKLRDAYDDFVKKYGPINREDVTVTKRLNRAGEPVTITRQPNLAKFMDDPDAWKVASIENYDSESGKAKRADIQNKDVIGAPRERQINGPSDALAAALDDTGGVDLDHIGQALNLETHDEVVRALGDLIYQNPDGRAWETADGYLSGDVVKKLEDARAIAQEDPSYLRNVSALEKVQPTPISGADITAQFGAPWVPAEVYQDFMKEVLGASNPRVARVPVTGEWRMKIDSVSRDARSKFGTDRVSAEEVADAALNNRQITVYDRGPDDTRTVNDKATTDARVKTELLKEAFTGDQDHGIDGWAFADPDRAQKLEAIFNRTYNNLVPRKFDGTHLTLPGLNPDFATRQHRKDVVWRIIQNGNTLMAHAVGSGKTASMIAAGMEQKRLGLINKPMFAIPNHMLEQFSREFIQAYPDAKILVAQKDEMTRDNRRAFLAKVASNDWDGVIITHDAFGRINMGKEFRQRFVQEQLDEMSRVLEAEEKEGGKKSLTVKNLERAKKKLQQRLSDLMNEEAKDPGTSFEESGIDFLFIDEAHRYKNLAFASRLGRVKGLSQGDSQRAEDLFMKMRYLEQNRPGRSGVFATGTPVSNTMAELWTMQRYLQLDKLRERGLDNFDSWANTFGRVVNNMELSADGRTFKEVSSFSKFVNVPELISLYSEVADTKTADMLNLPRPEVKTRSGKPGIEIVEAEPSSQEEEHIQSLVKLAESLKGKRPEKGQPNMLSVVTQGRKVATDGRLISEDFDFNPQGKIAKAVDNIARIYKEGKEPGLVQMVFLDMGVPHPKGTPKPKVREPGVEGEGIDPAQAETPRIDLYADIKKRLVEQGIPAREIAAIHDATDDAKKAKLFSRVRSGDVRVILGSSEKMGVGTNVQDRLIAMHHLDAPWKPAEVEQRDGRIVRQGNKNPEVQLYRYVTKRSFDAFMWQKLDTKARFIGQVLSGAKGSRHAEDIDNPLPEAAEMKAAASGDPRIIELAEIDRQVRSLTAQRRAFESTRSRADWEVGAAKSRIEQYETALPNAREDAALVTDIAGDKFAVDLGGTVVADRKEAGQAILQRLSALNAQTFYAPKVVNIGRLSGFEMNIEVRSGWSGDGTILKATPSLRGKSAYASPNDMVINEHTDPGGLMRRFENILGNIRDNPARLDRELAGERDNVKRLEKTLKETWPKEKDYREALQRLDDLTKSMKAPTHPDVREAADKPIGESDKPFSEDVKAQVPDTPEFRRWFGDSKVVDDNGAPKVVYHGSPNFTHDKGIIGGGFSTFDRMTTARVIPGRKPGMDNVGSWFSDMPGEKGAGMYAGPGSIYPVHLAIKNPWRPEGFGEFLEKLNAAAGRDVKKAQKKGEPLGRANPEPLREWLKEHGYDGIEFPKGTVDGKEQRVWVALEPEQIKSAIGNSGAFDPTNPDIRARRGWDVAEGRDLGPKEGERAVRLGTKTEAHVKTAGYTEKERDIAKAVKEIGERMAPQATVRGVSALRFNKAPAWGVFVNNENFPHLIAWSLEHGTERGVAPIAGTVRHEIIHHLRQSGLIRPEEWAALRDAAIAGDWMNKYNIHDRYAGLSLDHKIEEAVADHFSQWRTDRAVISRIKGDPVQRLIRGAYNRLDLFMRRVAAAARQFLGKNATANDVFTRIETGEVGRRTSEQIEAQKRYFAERDQGREAAQAARQTETPEFKRWFGDSKVADAQGRPEIAYHGTRSDFTSFDQGRSRANTGHPTAGLGFWFSKDPKIAEMFAGEQLDPSAWPPKMLPASGARTIPAYLSIENPYEMRLGELLNMTRPTKHPRDIGQFKSDLIAKGYDGIHVKGDPQVAERFGGDEYGADTWVAFNPEQIKSATGNRGTFDPFNADIRAQTPGGEARERREFERRILPPTTVMGKVGAAGDALRAKSADFAKRLGVDEMVRDMQIRIAPMAARDATVTSRAIAKEFVNARRQSRENWNRADKYIMDNFDADARRRMWDAADEESVAIQQRRPTDGIGLDRLAPAEREVVETLQRYGQEAFNEAVGLKMVEGPGLPSYAPRMVVRMSEGKFERGAGEGAEVVRDVRTLALATARLDDAIAARRLIDSIAEIGNRSGNPTVNEGGAPARRPGPEAQVANVLDQIGRGVSTTTPQLRQRKYLTREETEAAAGRVPGRDVDAPDWFTLSHPAFQRWEPRLTRNEETGRTEAVKDENGNIVFDRKPIYVRADFEGPLRAVLSKNSNKLYNALMALKGKAMSVIMMSPMIHNQVEWGRALPAAPGKVVTGQIYFEGNRVANDPAKMREAISGGVVPIGGHGFMQDILSIAEAPTVRPGRSWTAKGAGAAAQALGAITHIYDPRAGNDAVRRAVDYMGNVWHNTLLWDRIRDLQMGIWSHLREHLIDKGYDPYAANVAAAHFANRYAGALPIEAMSGIARGVANVLLFSRTFTLGNIGAYKDAISGLPRDAQALIQRNVGWDELQKIQSFVKRKSRAMLALDAGLFYATLSALQSSFNVVGVGHTMATLGGMIAGGALGGRGGRYGRLAAAGALGATGFGLASVLGASDGTRTLEDELGRYWDRFSGLLTRIGEHPFSTLGNPFKMIESLGATAENEPGLQNRLLVGYQPDGTAIYARLPAGKVTEEAIGYATEPNEMLHRKMSTIARPLDQIFENNIGFGRKAYNPKADTPAEVGKNIIKIAGLLIGSQLPVDTVKGAIDWFRGGPGSDTSGLKAVAPVLLGTTVRKGYPGGPELGEVAAADEKHRYQVQEALPDIRDQIKKGDTAGAIARMQELQIPPSLQQFYIRTTLEPVSRLTKRKAGEFYSYATPEEKARFEQRSQERQGRASGGVVEDRRGESDRDVLGRLSSESAYPPNQITGDIDSSLARDAGINDVDKNLGRRDPIKDLIERQRAAGGRVVAANINHEPTEAQRRSGVYAKDHVHLHGLRISIENAKGSTRRGVGRDGKPWQTILPYHYGDIKRTEGSDGDAIDICLGPHPKSPHVFVIDQVDADTKRFDESKVMLGYGSRKQAEKAYLAGFSDSKGKDRLGHMTEMSITQFKRWLEHGDTTEPIKPKRGKLKPITKVDRSHDVPYLSGPSNDGGTMYIDRRVPRTIVVKGKKLDPSIPLRIHEQTEQRLMVGRGMSYEDAHKQATAAERDWVESHGYDWGHYEACMDGLLSSIEHENPKDPPVDLFLKPYPCREKKIIRRDIAREPHTA